MKLFLTIICTIIYISTFAQNVVTINGICPLIKDGTEISFVNWTPRRFSDNKTFTVKTTDHKFSLQLPAQAGEGYLIYLNKRLTRVYLEPGNATINIPDSTLNKVIVIGNLAATEYNNFNLSQSSGPQTKHFNNARIKYLRYLESRNTNSDTLVLLKKMVDSMSILKHQQDIELTLDHVKKHPASLLNTFILYNIIDDVPEDTIRDIFKTLPKVAVENIWGKELKYRIDSLFIGGKAPDFTQADTGGKKVSLKNFKGKYVLIDFWASWCVPCRAENPNLIMANDKYRNKNFTILSISLDSDKAKWLQAIKTDKLPWTHLSDLKVWDNEASSKYYVYAVPNNYLIAPNGKIVAKNIRGEELNKTLEKFLSPHQ